MEDGSLVFLCIAKRVWKKRHMSKAVLRALIVVPWNIARETKHQLWVVWETAVSWNSTRVRTVTSVNLLKTPVFLGCEQGPK